ncbi:MAG TPA: HAD-IA family hydrolase [Blastocatellia bacterium]|nr:HAD-IA family hydrolase [Blastocatellia bacterium]
MSMAFDLITFDCYGTLIDWEKGIVSAFQREAARAGRKLDAGAIVAAYHAEEPAVESEAYRPYRDVLTKTAQRVASRLGLSIEPERAGFLVDSLPHWPPFADTNAALERLVQRYRLGILSNVDDDLLAATRKLFTVRFDLIVTAEQVGSYKPSHGHFIEARWRAGEARWLHAAQSYFHDVLPASALDIPVVWVNRKRERPDTGGPLPMLEVTNLTELADRLGV